MTINPKEKKQIKRVEKKPQQQQMKFWKNRERKNRKLNSTMNLLVYKIYQKSLI